jgi:hypothetical protein
MVMLRQLLSCQLLLLQRLCQWHQAAQLLLVLLTVARHVCRSLSQLLCQPLLMLMLQWVLRAVQQMLRLR